MSAPLDPRSQAGAAAATAVPRPRPDQAPRPRHLRVVETGTLSPAARRRRARAVLVALIAAVTLICFALVYLHVMLAQRQFALDRLTSQVQKEQATYQTLRLKVAELGSPQHIVSTAEGQLGMVQPTKVTYLTSPASAPGAKRSGASGSQQAATGGSVGSTAPSGDANWPQIKSQLAGTP